MDGANSLVAGCSLGSVMIERTDNMERRMDRHDEEQANTIRGLQKKVDRLPHWAVIAGWFMALTIGWLAHYIH